MTIQTESSVFSQAANTGAAIGTGQPNRLGKALSTREILEKLAMERQETFNIECTIGDTEFIPKVEGCDYGAVEIQGSRYNLCSAWGAKQYLRKVGVPYQYFKKCASGLRETNVKAWTKGEHAGEKVRFIIRNNKVAGCISQKISTISNYDVFNTILTKVPDGFNRESMRFNSCESHHTCALAIGDWVDPIKGEKPDLLRPGFEVSFSDVGGCQLSFESFIFRQICSNGMVARAENRALARRAYLGLNTELIGQSATAAFNLGLQIGNKYLEAFAKTKSEKFNEVSSDMIAEILETSPRAKLVERVKEAHTVERDNTLYGVINAITAVARDENNLFARAKMERFAGNLILAHAA
jgi:hypothetical protein